MVTIFSILMNVELNELRMAMDSIAPKNLTDEICWEATVTRDRRYDGVFVLAVRSTGIYCRPSCPARKPRREQVTFFMRPNEAEEAGFRACKRCNPDKQAFEAETAALVCRYIEEHLDDRLTLDDLSAVANLSPQHLQRVFKRATGISPREYVEARRVEALKGHLKAGVGVTRALYEAGYSSSSRVYESSDAALGMTPATYRRGGAGIEIGYTVVACPLGWLLVAGTERGICAVSLGDSAVLLEETLRSDYPAAEVKRDDEALGGAVGIILDYLKGEQPHLELPLDVRATAFQRRVWQELQAIPYGETRSYSEIAAAVGNPKGARAVARACASNQAALIIPCHRVVREDGDLGGYRWGMERKQALLEREKQGVDKLKDAISQAD